MDFYTVLLAVGLVQQLVALQLHLHKEKVSLPMHIPVHIVIATGILASIMNFALPLLIHCMREVKICI